MKTNIFKIFCVMLVISSALSCDDFLNNEPVSYVTKDKFWRSEADVNIAVSAMYNSFCNAMSGRTGSQAGNIYDFGEVRGGNWNGNSYFGVYQQELASHAISPLNLATFWTFFYQTIGRANLVLKYTPNISMNTASKSKLLGEAYAMRAWCYFYLVRVWGDVPIFLEPLETYSTEEAMKPRIPKDIVIEQILKDLLLAEQYLPAMPAAIASVDRNRINKYTVYALLMDVYAWTHQYDMVIDVMENKVRKLSNNIWGLEPAVIKGLNQTDFTNNWRAIFNESPQPISKEVIFSLQYVYTETGSNMQMGYFVTGGPRLIVSDALLGCYAPNDLRRLATFNGNKLNKFWRVGTSFSGTVYSENDLVMYRYADLQLLYSEALAETDQIALAVKELNTIRERAGVTPALVTDFVEKQELIDAILHERRVELIGEGKYWFDLVRTGNALRLGACPDQNKILFPINSNHLFQNKNLTQNPGY